MQRITFFLFLLLICSLVACTPPDAAEGDESDEAKPADSTAADDEMSEVMKRNMFGHYIPRGVTVSNDNIDEGYVMFVKPNSGSVYLINRKGEVVHEWKSRNIVMGGYLLDDGSLMINAFDPDYPRFYGGGAAGRLQKISWDGRILWDYEMATKDELHHHDFAVMPNGNVLAIAWEAKTREEAIQAGRNPEFVAEAGLWPDKIVEIKPTGKYDGEVVWEWHIWDHLIQDFDPQRDNYGNPADHPELLDINAMAHKVKLTHPDSINIYLDSLDYKKAEGEAHRNAELGSEYADVYHFNALNYNADLDQIVVSSPEIGEIFIIDHSTTSAQAKSHSGGKRGRGGDFLYRWGNPANYQKGDSTLRKLFYQHDIRWVENNKPGAGHLTVYNNSIPNGPDSMRYSAVYEIVPELDVRGNYALDENGRYKPEEPSWVYVASDTISFWGGFISGAHRMENGNTFINEGPKGRFFEVTPKGEIVWEYLNQFRGTATELNGDPSDIMPMTYMQFRSTFIPATHPGLESTTLEPMDPQPEIFTLPPREEPADTTAIAGLR